MTETIPRLTDEYVAQVKKALDELNGKLTQPKAEVIPKEDDNKTTVQRAEEELENKKDQPLSTVENSDCCCMLESWILEEKDRKFKLEVVKDEKWVKPSYVKPRGNSNNTTNKRAIRLNYRKKHQATKLYVVTSPASPNGNVTYKEITTNHKFKKKNCDLKILAKKGKQKVYLTEGEVLEIDSNGDIIEKKNHKKKEVEHYVTPKPKYPPVDVPIPEGKRIKAYRNQPKPFSTPILEKVPIPEYPVDSYVTPKNKRVAGYKNERHFEGYGLIPTSTYMKSVPYFEDIPKPKYDLRKKDKVIPIGKQIKVYQNVTATGLRRSTLRNRKIFEYESYPLFEDIPNMPQDKSSFLTLIQMLVNPFSAIDSYPIILSAEGSSKCSDNTVYIYPIEHLEADIDLIIDFHMFDQVTFKQSDLERAKKKATFEAIDKYFKIEGKAVVKRGSQSFEYAKEYEKVVKKNLTRKEAKSFFNGIREPITRFYQFFHEADKKRREGAIFSFSPGNTQFYVKVKGLKISESQEDYGRDWEGKVEVALVLFNGSGGKLDLINLIISRGDKKISTFVKDVRDRLKKGFASEYAEGNAEIEANLVLSGGITGLISWDKKVGKDVVAEGEFSGSVGFALETKIHLEGRVWELKVSAGAELKTTSEKDTAAPSEFKASLKASKGTNGADLDWTGDVMFTGFGIYWGFYAELRWEDAIKTDSNKKVRGGIKNLKTPKWTTEGSLVLLKEHSFWNKVMHDMPNQKYTAGVPTYLVH